MLSRFPWDVDVKIAGNGQEAVDLVKRLKFDVIFMDIQMPVMDGIAATKVIRKAGNKTPIVALTASASTNSRDECYAAGMDTFLTKPVRIDEIRQVIEGVHF